MKYVSLTNEVGQDAALGICQSVDADAVFDIDGKPFGPDRVVVQIVESLCETKVPSV